MRKGIIIRIDQSAGRGFIEDENLQEIAFCLNGMDGNIKINDLVEFEIELTAHGLTAINISVLMLIKC